MCLGNRKISLQLFIVFQRALLTHDIKLESKNKNINIMIIAYGVPIIQSS